MGKNLIVVALALMLCAVLPQGISAQTATPSESETATNTARSDKLQQRQEELKKKQQALREQINQKREEAKTRIQAQRDIFKARLAELKDEKKKALVEKIDAKMAMVNEKRTDNMLDAIERISVILDKIAQKADTLKTEGVDTTALDQALTNAQTAIDTATTAVNTQAAKQYTITLTEETVLRQDVMNAFKSLQEDLRATHATVVDAKQTTMIAARELAKLRKIDLTTEQIQATPTIVQ